MAAAAAAAAITPSLVWGRVVMWGSFFPVVAQVLGLAKVAVAASGVSQLILGSAAYRWYRRGII
jgi:hypothetical protein